MLPPGPGRHPLDQADTPPDQADTPLDQADTPLDQADTPQTRQNPLPPQKQTPAYGLRAASTHPTGMHSCSKSFVGKVLLRIKQKFELTYAL